jgi:hypothetical protein
LVIVTAEDRRQWWVHAAVPWLLVGLAMAVVQIPALALVHAVSQPLFVGTASGLWAAFTAVVVGRRALSPWGAAAGAVSLQVGLGIVFGLLALLLRVPLQFLVVFGAHTLVVVAVAAAAGLSRAGVRAAPVWAGLAAGLLGGIVVMLWGLGHTGRGVLAAGALLVAVAVVLLARRARHVPIVVPTAAAVAVTVAPVYALVPAAFDALFPVLAG